MATKTESFADDKNFELKVHPLDEEEFIGVIKIEKNDDASRKTPAFVPIVILLDRSGSMRDSARRISNEVIPLFLSKLSYKNSHVIHFITFESNTQMYSVTVERMKSLPIRASGGTHMAPAVRKCQILFQSFNRHEPIRVLTISDGQVGDRQETEKAATAFVEHLKSRDISINSQAVRLFTSSSQPDTKALCSLLQINNTTTSQLLDISTSETNEAMATKIAELFKSDSLSSSQSLTTDGKIIMKFPWESAASAQLTLVPGENLFWLTAVPSEELKIGDVPVKVSMQAPLTLDKFQDLMEGKLFYIVDHMKILKVIGTDEANKKVKQMVEYFEKKETDLAEKSPPVDESVQRKKISEVLTNIADDDKVKLLDSAEKAEYLRKTVEPKEENAAFVEEAKVVYAEEPNEEEAAFAEEPMEEEKPSEKAVTDTINVPRKEFFVFFLILFLAVTIYKMFHD